METLSIIIFTYYIIGWVLATIKLTYDVIVIDFNMIDCEEKISLLMIAFFWLPLLLYLVLSGFYFVLDVIKKKLKNKSNAE